MLAERGDANGAGRVGVLVFRKLADVSRALIFLLLLPLLGLPLLDSLLELGPHEHRGALGARGHVVVCSFLR